jgi:NADPH-dependent glutamate synthase beta subunit-like oxidoreductase
VEERLRGFGPVELGYTPEQAREEAGRCLHCDLEERE